MTDGVPQLNRKPLTVNPNRKQRKAEFGFNSNLGYKSKAEPSVISWANRGKGVQGETVNSQNVASKFVIRKAGKAL
ncbi:hypothetical protein UFOVP1033_137 [uncultured Caudovirales phage]|uniref:Uncharacterized protein n=1 Tax=uncultured Caudovirales phage TaxID=2100421 RepID=A0A6J5SZQ8_9CAUD|nr:hypothetical protein UFOVP1033_137 [uncultured Caudovirales phage]CAB4221023.1 hypothetical protein UFOVP1631_137 [uncultured Caudovirales phage]